MYKIMTKLHTSRENVFAFHMGPNDQGEIVEYGVLTPTEAAAKALELLGKVGYEDLRIVDDKSYYLDLVYGKKPVPEPNLYVLNYENIKGYTPDKEVIENIEEGATVSSLITFDSEVIAFHLIVDGKEYKTGNPAWIDFEELSSSEVKIIYSGITRDHTVEIVIDDDIIINPDTEPEIDSI
jgi:hypothetical protein